MSYEVVFGSWLRPRELTGSRRVDDLESALSARDAFLARGFVAQVEYTTGDGTPIQGPAQAQGQKLSR